MLRLTVPLLGLAALSLAACSPDRPVAEMSEASADTMFNMDASAAAVSDASSDLTGRWTGVEGTYLNITPAANGYTVEIANLDGPRTFEGRADGDAIVFERDGTPLRIRKGTGTETRMKWLEGKNDCVVVDANEGYCRD